MKRRVSLYTYAETHHLVAHLMTPALIFQSKKYRLQQTGEQVCGLHDH